MQKKWSANFVNDPNNDFELIVEICYGNEDIAIIRKEKEVIKFKFYKNDENINIPFDWLFEVMKEAKETL